MSTDLSAPPARSGAFAADSPRGESGASPSPAGASAADTKMQDLTIQAAEFQAAGARALAKERLGGREDVMRAERDLAIAKARGDAVEMARIQVAHAQFGRNGMVALHKEKMAPKPDAMAAELALQKCASGARKGAGCEGEARSFGVTQLHLLRTD